MKKGILILGFLYLGAYVLAQSVEVGPYTVTEISENVFHIEDANASNPPGATIGDDGQQVSMNNCSDMYLVIGQRKGLLIDLSNRITWHDAAEESLHTLVYERVGDRPLIITVTHNHGDHLGMLPAFADDPRASFWLSENEFIGKGTFPEETTSYFTENSSLDLGGGMSISTIEVPGHTAHSILLFLDGKDIVFSGDAIGSGSGVWLFNEESFYTYKESIDKLLAYIEDPENNINRDKLIVWGGTTGRGRKLEIWTYSIFMICKRLSRK